MDCGLVKHVTISFKPVSVSVSVSVPGCSSAREPMAELPVAGLVGGEVNRGVDA
jgi:hypothetical protein